MPLRSPAWRIFSPGSHSKSRAPFLALTTTFTRSYLLVADSRTVLARPVNDPVDGDERHDARTITPPSRAPPWLKALYRECSASREPKPLTPFDQPRRGRSWTSYRSASDCRLACDSGRWPVRPVVLPPPQARIKGRCVIGSARRRSVSRAVSLAHDTQHGVHGVVDAHAGVGEAADGADDGAHPVGRGQLEAKALSEDIKLAFQQESVTRSLAKVNARPPGGGRASHAGHRPAC